MYESFSDEARRAMAIANQVAMRFGHQYIAPEHILLGVLAQTGLAEVCTSLGVAPDVVKREVEDALETMPSPTGGVAKKIIENTIEEARALRHKAVSTHHVLLGILRLAETYASKALHEAGLTTDRLRDELTKRFPPEFDVPEPPPKDLVKQFQSHPEVQALQQQVEDFQRQQLTALENQDFRAAVELRDKKVEARIQLKALLDRLRKE